MKYILIFAVTMIVSCGVWDYTIDLGGGYRLTRTNASTVVIFSPSGVENRSHPSNGVAVPPKIVSCWQNGDFIWGETVKSEDSELKKISVSGWFSLNLKSGNYSIYPSKNDLMDYLAENKIVTSEAKKHL